MALLCRVLLNRLQGQSRAETCATVREAKGWQGAILLLPCAGEGRRGVLPAWQIVMLPVTLAIRSGWDFLLTSGWQVGFLLFSAPWSKTSF